MRKSAKRLVGAGVVAAAAYAVWRAFDARRAESTVTWQPQPFPYPPVPRTPASEPASGDRATPGEVPQVRGQDADATMDSTVGPPAWVEPDGTACPTTHPVKAKLSSGIYHVPGGANYDRSRPDRCYATPEAAEADGLRAAKA